MLIAMESVHLHSLIRSRWYFPQLSFTSSANISPATEFIKVTLELSRNFPKQCVLKCGFSRSTRGCLPSHPSPSNSADLHPQFQVDSLSILQNRTCFLSVFQSSDVYRRVARAPKGQQKSVERNDRLCTLS